jgi:tetratricopeptide (TPR) repeat protein
MILFSLRSLTAKGRVDRLVVRAGLLLDAGERISAIKILTRIISTDRGHPQASWMLAKIYADTGQFTHAEMTLRDILYANRCGKDPSEESVRELLADIYERRGEYRKAAGEYFLLRNSSRLAPTSAIRAGRMSLDHHRIREAELFLQEAQRRDRRNPEILFLLGRLEYQRMNTRAALQYLQAGFDGGWDTPETRLFLARSLLLRGDFKTALEHLEALPLKQLAGAEIEDMIGRCLFSLREDTDADTVASLMKLVAELEQISSPLLPSALFALGCGREAMGQTEEAISIWTDAFRRFGHGPSKEKCGFYEGPGRDLAVKSFLSLPPDRFITKAIALAERFGLQAEEHPPVQNARSCEFVCRNLHGLNPYHKTLVHFRRNTSPIPVAELEDLVRLRDKRRVRDLLVVAPLFSPEAVVWCEKKNVATKPLLELLGVRTKG